MGAFFLVYSFHCYLVITVLFVFTPTTFIVTLIVTLIVTIHSKLGSSKSESRNIVVSGHTTER